MTVYSHSRIGTFETCPRQFWFAYIEKPEIVRPESVEAFLGSRAHDALEDLHKRQLNGRLLSREEALAVFDDLWAKKWDDEIRVVRREMKAADYRQVGRQAVAAYYDRYQPFDQDRTLGLESKVSITLDKAGQYRMQGYIDRLAQRGDGVYEIHDYKTSGHLMVQSEADADRQLALYQIGVESMWNDVAQVELVWHYLRFDKEIRSRRTPEQLAEVKTACIRVIENIESRGREADSFPPCPSNLCDWCDYRSLCPATRHYVAVEKLPPAKFKADSGVTLVDLLAKLKGQKQELQEQVAAIDMQIESATETLIRFAKQKGLTSVCGSTHGANVAETQKIVLPESGSPERDDLEAALCKAGLFEQVSTVNWSKLNSLWINGELPDKTRRALAKFIEVVEDVHVRLKALPKTED